MRSVFCFFLSLILICSLIFAGSAPVKAAPLPVRTAAWWGLLFPGLFGPDDGRVVFEWPLLKRLRALVA